MVKFRKSKNTDVVTPEPVTPPTRSLTEIVDGVKQISRHFQAVIALAEIVKNLDSLERAAREAELRYAEKMSREAEIDARFAEAAAADAHRQEVEQQAKALLAEAQAAANLTAQAAEKAKQETLAAGQAAADQVLAHAKDEAKGIKAKAEQKAQEIVAKANAQKEQIETATGAQETLLAEVTAAVSAAQSEYDALQGKIAAAKEQIAKMLG